MRVTSGLADVDFEVHSIAREDSLLVVRDRDRGGGVPTVVYVAPQDIVDGLKALCSSPRSLALVFSALFRRRGIAPSPVADTTWNDPVNNPWVQ